MSKHGREIWSNDVWVYMDMSFIRERGSRRQIFLSLVETEKGDFASLHPLTVSTFHDYQSYRDDQRTPETANAVRGIRMK